MKTQKITPKTASQLRKEAALAEKYVLFSNQFGYDIYVADENLSGGSPVTEKIDEAIKYAVGYDNPVIKLGYWRAVTGLELRVRNI